MIDLHFHCLPGIDDGPASLEDAVALCRAAAEEGVESLVATPHVLRGDWINEAPAARDELVLRLNDQLGGDPRSSPAASITSRRRCSTSSSAAPPVRSRD